MKSDKFHIPEDGFTDKDLQGNLSKEQYDEAVAKMGYKPIWPIGECFDSSAVAIIHPECPEDAILCHGIGIANMPGQEGNKVAHAWVEYGDQACDTTWGLRIPVGVYREKFSVSGVVTYSKKEALANIEKHDMGGPWDEKIKKVVKLIEGEQ